MPFGERVMEAGTVNEGERLVEEFVVAFGYAGTATPSFSQTKPPKCRWRSTNIEWIPRNYSLTTKL